MTDFIKNKYSKLKPYFYGMITGYVVYAIGSGLLGYVMDIDIGDNIGMVGVAISFIKTNLGHASLKNCKINFGRCFSHKKLLI